MAVRHLVPFLACAVLAGAVACSGDEQTPAVEAAPVERVEVSAEARRQPPFGLLKAWLAAFNSGDRDGYTRFTEAKFPAQVAALDQEMAFRQMTGGFHLRKVGTATGTKLTGWLEERDSDQFVEFELGLELDRDAAVRGTFRAARPHRIASLQLRPIPRPASFPVTRLTESQAVAGAEALARRLAASDRFSGTLLVAKDGDVIFSKAFGLADRDRSIPNSIETRFRIGSMNKMFTAVAILQLVEAGKIELDAPVGTYIRDYPRKDVARKVTIHQLLTHTGGTGDIFGWGFDRDALRTHADYVEAFGTRGLESEPGSRFLYSNFGFVLLGRVVEAVSGQSYYDYVEENVYRPAGMTRTGSLPERAALPDLSVGYVTPPPGTDGWAPNVDLLPYRGMAAGGGYSTVEDLAGFADALLDHELLGEDSTELLITGKVEAFPGSMYAYGFEDARDEDGAGWVGHGGGFPGTNGDLKISPKSGYAVAVLANMDPPAAQRISAYLAARLPAG